MALTMSLITRCPACTTLFKVVPDQLRVSEGWVRCGQCDEVFDANAHLQNDGHEQSPLPMAPAERDPATQTEPDPKNTASQVAGPIEESDGYTEPQTPVDPNPHLEQELAARLEWPESLSTNYDALMDVRPGAVFQAEPALHLELPGEEPELQMPEADVVTYALGVEPSWEESLAQIPAEFLEEAEPVVIAAAPASSTIESAPTPLSAHVPAFMRTARTDSHWDRPWVRHSMACLAGLLLMSLGIQVALQERNRLAANVPDLRPSLAAMCEVLDCQIAPFKQIDSVAIDASSFVKVRGDVYRLNVTLKNTALIDVAAPAVELTLTDTQDQPMIRHVLSAAELGAQQGILVASGELTTALPVNVKTAGSSERISGYRLLAFYP